MLQTQTVSPELLELLKKITKSEFFSDFIFVGGTALALQIGHRNSVDLDFFVKKEIKEVKFLNELKKIGETRKISRGEICKERINEENFKLGFL